MTTAPWYAPYVAKASGWLSDAASLADMAQGSTVNLAVTGLSRSGKTVFITSLIHNLLSAVHNPNRMPLLGVVAKRPADGHAAGAAPAPRRLPRFRYQENIEAMAAGAPSWPAGTDDLREIGIEVRFMPANAPGKLLSEISGSPATLTIRIVDYPGEWLLDLPLLGQSLCRVVARDACGSTGAACAPRRHPNSSPSSRSTATTRPRATRPPSRRTTSIARS